MCVVLVVDMVFDVAGLRVNPGREEGLAASDGDIRSALLQAEVVGEMVVASDGSASDRDHTIVEISDTAHQISQGSFLIPFFAYCTCLHCYFLEFAVCSLC